MTIIGFIWKEAAAERPKLFIAATGAGLANTLVLTLVTVFAQSPESAGVRSFFLFLFAVLVYVLAARYVFHRMTDIVEEVLYRLKSRIVEKIGRAELAGIERLGTAEIYDRITENATVISNAAGVVTNVMQQIVIFVFAVLYVAWMSLPAFILVAFLIGVGLTLYFTRSEGMTPLLKALGKTRIAFLENLTDLLRGFKEVKLGRERGREIRADIDVASASLRDVSRKANHLFDENFILVCATQFALLGALVFVLPQHVTVESATLSKLVAAVMFLWGPLQGAVSGYPAYVRSNHAIADILALEAKLEGVEDTAELANAEDAWKGTPGTLTLRDVEYAYAGTNGDPSFRIGPIDLSIEPGEILFIVGGNGSGKSTLLKVLTGLYPVTSGTLRASDATVRPENVASYREMISAIFSDFHLFSRVYGLLGADEALVRRLLVEMQLDKKTDFKDGRFTKRDLSTGQRKRLAMIVSLLEDRPICVFDEWAADQDPEFRAYFYDELLPSLRRRGKTVIAVSHDDRFFHCADRVVTMDYGKIRSIDGGRPHVPPTSSSSNEMKTPREAMP
ncbi:cyclic peptide export ABC transporter [Polyangium mundeleinium]|uniref:Cyclic peptide export ABC transporter n=1 Tax=Polyangium mundeleinium TaxID=2995306 RepID=A0ABT5EZ22_9BACT|nr:cyclic peptide export ABC transporter [Polyangium mundeleinium]MDC0747083.1 cyclic peptide export ABC transporter [Polyangium mundeleinium]